MLDRQFSVDKKGHKTEVFDIAGSKGNIYQVTIGLSPNCTCWDARTREQRCKHIKYALIIILKAPVYLQYQHAFLSEELDSIFKNAPVTQAVLDHDHGYHVSSEPTYDGKRKPVEGDCPICVFEMNSEEDIVWYVSVLLQLGEAALTCTTSYFPVRSVDLRYLGARQHVARTFTKSASSNGAGASMAARFVIL